MGCAQSADVREPGESVTRATHSSELCLNQLRKLQGDWLGCYEEGGQDSISVYNCAVEFTSPDGVPHHYTIIVKNDRIFMNGWSIYDLKDDEVCWQDGAGELATWTREQEVFPTSALAREKQSFGLAPSMIVRAKKDFDSDSKGPNKVQLLSGATGTVWHIDEHGDAHIKFDAHESSQWVFKEHFHFLEIIEHGCLKLGDEVKVKTDFAVPGKQLKRGEKGHVVSFDEDGWANIQFDAHGAEHLLPPYRFTDFAPASQVEEVAYGEANPGPQQCCVAESTMSEPWATLNQVVSGCRGMPVKATVVEALSGCRGMQVQQPAAAASPSASPAPAAETSAIETVPQAAAATPSEEGPPPALVEGGAPGEPLPPGPPPADDGALGAEEPLPAGPPPAAAEAAPDADQEQNPQMV